MSVETNGKLVDSKGVNGRANGQMNGHTNVKANGQIIPSRKSTTIKKQKSFTFVGLIARALTWYTIFSVLFRCPSTADQLTESSSRVCKPYFQLKSFVSPYLEPYYNTYAASYVDAARPYYETLDKRVITPATAFGTKYGAPRVAQAQSFGQAQWEKTVQPQVTRVQGLAKKQYDANLARHVDTVTKTTGPYLDIAKTNALQTYYGHILPTYNTVQPYVLQGYGVASAFAVNTALPYSKWAWTTGTVFLDRTVWPRLRILYGENVEPQLVRIGERLGRYRDGKKLKAAVDEIDISSSASSASATLSSIASSVSSAHATKSTSSVVLSSTVDSSVVPESTQQSEKDTREKAQAIVTNDLKTWQEKFAKAANEGSDELEIRINEITDKAIKSQAQGVGRALIIELEETATSNFKNLKSKIRSIVQNSKDGDDSEEAINLAARKAGALIKEKAQAVRTWRKNYDNEVNLLISKAAEDTFDIIDHIRDLGLQEIGMRWAWTDGITHKDWAKYHQLKNKFDEWRVDVEKVATEHPGLLKARAASEDVENKAMARAGDAAKELLRLKEAGLWKLSAQDSSDDFNNKYVPAAAAVARQKISNKFNDASEAIVGTTTTQGNVESAASVASAYVSSKADNVQNAGDSIASSLSSSIIGTSQGTIESIASVASASASSLSAQVSSSVIGKEPGVMEKASSSIKSGASSISSAASSLSKAASSSISSGSSVIGSVSSSVASSLSISATESSSSASSAASSASSSASKKVWGGAMAQDVPNVRKIILDDVIEESDDEAYSGKIQSMASEAGDRYSDITKAVSEALFKPTSTDRFPMTKVAASQYSSAFSAASVALYGTEKGTGESVSSLVSSRYKDAVAAASSVVYGTPAPVTDSITSQASSIYNNAVSKASEHYSQGLSLLSAQISGTPKPAHEQMLSSVQSVYSDSLGAANSKLQEALSAGSTLAYATPTPTYQAALSSASALASSRLSEGLRLASERFEKGKSYVNSASIQGPSSQKLVHQMKVQFYAGVGMAHAQYTDFVDAASSAILPSQTPYHESLYSKASEGIIGTPTKQYGDSLATATMFLANALSTASSQLNNAMSSISSLAGTTSAPATETLASAASSRYSEAILLASASYSSVQSVLSEKYEKASSAASSAVIGSQTPWTESAASKASENWESLITKVSSNVYGAQTPHYITRSLFSEVQDYAAQVTDGAVAQYSSMQSLISELVSGKEPDFTESVYKRFAAAYPTGALSSASSVAGEVYESASSVITSIFTPPPAIENILDTASSRVNDVVEAASIQFYGSEKGRFEQLTEAAASSFSSAQSVASVNIYGTSTGYAEAYQSSLADAASSAQKAISEAIYGTPTGTIASVTNVAGDSLSTATSIIADNVSTMTSLASVQYSAASAGISSMIYGPEKGAVESAQARLGAAVESARSRLSEFAAHAGAGASDTVQKASEAVENFASSVSSVVGSATGHAKDEL